MLYCLFVGAGVFAAFILALFTGQTDSALVALGAALFCFYAAVDD